MVPCVIYFRSSYIRLLWCKLGKGALIPPTLPSRRLQSSPLVASRARSDSRQHCEQLTSVTYYMETAAAASGEKSSSMEESADAEECRAKRPQFGNRFLETPENIFQHNAWDNVSWDPEQLEAAKKKVAENSDVFIDLDRQESYETEADRYWNDFYSQHQNKFFKDRHWLFTEFPELSSSVQDVSHPGPDARAQRAVPSIDTGGKTDSDSGGEMGVPSRDEPRGCACCSVPKNKEDGVLGYPGCSASKRILEVGCGVGNTIYPILRTNEDQGLFVYGCDFSSVAVEIVRQHIEYDPKRCLSFVCDISDQEAVFPFPPGSLDVIVMIFVLSAINPDKFQSTITTLSGLLKPGGLLLFRDYGRYDMAQLRFKKGRCLAENFYVRGDGTRVYFFTQDELRTLFTNAGLTEEQNLIDRRLQVNRGRQLTMYRVWIQCKYKK